MLFCFALCTKLQNWGTEVATMGTDFLQCAQQRPNLTFEFEVGKAVVQMSIEGSGWDVFTTVSDRIRH